MKRLRQASCLKVEAARLTLRSHCPYYGAMEMMNNVDSELDALEERIGRLAALVRRLRAENAGLSEQQRTTQAENVALRAKVDSASTRLQRLLEQLPEEAA